ncbi:MAG: MMPL family transporter [Spirochaetaceae bacterium]|nr:MMPL family transporter [Spirochaetaceae bacterium]
MKQPTRGAAWLERAVQSGMRSAARYPAVVLAIVAALTAAAGWSAARVGVSANVDELLPRDSEVVSLMEEHAQTREQIDWLILLAEGEGLFAPASLAALRGAVERIEARPEVTAVIDPYRFISYVRAGGRLLFEPAAPGGTAPVDAAAVERFRQRLAADPLARGLVVSDDGAALGVLFNVPLRADYRPLLAAVDAAVQPLRDAGVEVALAGMPTIDAATRDHLTGDLPLLLVVSVAVIMATYYVSFRSLAAMILPVLVVAIATVWTVGTMSALGLDFTIVSITTPPFVMTLGSAYSVHILTAYLLPAVGGGPGAGARAPHAERADRFAGSVAGLGPIGVTVVLAAVTTAAGFTGLATASIAAVREFGVITGLGIAYCAVLALLFLPACVQVLRVRPRPPRSDESMRLTKAMFALSGRVLAHRRSIAIVLPILFALLAVAALGLRYETDFTRFFRGRDTVMDSNLHVQRRLGGFVDFNVTISAPRDTAGEPQGGYFLRPEVLRQVARFEHEVRALPGVSWSYSFISELERMNLALSGRLEVPERRAALLLLARVLAAMRDAGSAMGAAPVSADGTQLHLNARVFDVREDTFFLEGRLRELLDRVEHLAGAHLPAELGVQIWSGSVAALRLTEVLVRDHLISMAVALVLVFAVAAVGFRSAALGVLALLPMAFGILVILAFLAITRRSLDTLTMMFSSVAVGAGVDYAVHVIVGFLRRARERPSGDAGRMIRATMVTSGRAIVINTVSLAAGLLVLALSSFTPVARLGGLLAATIAAAAVGSLAFVPAMLWYIRGRAPTAAGAATVVKGSH